jgi:predicted ArsR family transcriptional regulator
MIPDQEKCDGAAVSDTWRLVDLLADYGYVREASGGELSLANWPYEPVSGQDRGVVCSMNLALVEGAVEGVGLRGTECSLRAPQVARSCCVHVAWPDRGS